MDLIEKKKANHTYNKGSLSRIHKASKFNSKKPYNPIRKYAKDRNRHFIIVDIQMVNRHMKRYSTSLTIREMQIKTMMRYYEISLTMSKILIEYRSVGKDKRNQITQFIKKCGIPCF